MTKLGKKKHAANKKKAIIKKMKASGIEVPRGWKPAPKVPATRGQTSVYTGVRPLVNQDGTPFKIKGKSPIPKKSANGTVRINKRLSELGIATRKMADAMLEDGVVIVNGQIATIGQKVLPTDQIDIVGQRREEPVYFAYNKPVNIVTIGAQEGERDIRMVTEFNANVFPVGRLDKDSSGLLIMTNDGRVTDRLLSPQREHDKEYRVVVNRAITHQFLAKMRDGVRITPRELTRPTKIRRIDNHTFEIVLTEGRNRQIRRMCKALGYEVEKLSRFRVMNIELGKLPLGSYREIKGKELSEFLNILGLNNS
ncbi:MAG: pseudouridine synthase [Minisyncoccia bacterium]